MESPTFAEQRLLEKIRLLPPEQISQIEDFIDFLYQRLGDRALVQAATKLSEPALQKIWDNPEDAEYDHL